MGLAQSVALSLPWRRGEVATTAPLAASTVSTSRLPAPSRAPRLASRARGTRSSAQEVIRKGRSSWDRCGCGDEKCIRRIAEPRRMQGQRAAYRVGRSDSRVKTAAGANLVAMLAILQAVPNRFPVARTMNGPKRVICAAGVALYTRVTRTKDRTGTWAYVGLVGITSPTSSVSRHHLQQRSQCRRSRVGSSRAGACGSIDIGKRGDAPHLSASFVPFGT
jgi:hypothetical protein